MSNDLPANDPPDEIASAFEKHFGPAFQRVYAYVFARVDDADGAERLTRTVLTRSLPALIESEEPELSVILLRAANALLRAEGKQRVVD